MKARVFAVTTILMLAVGIGATVAIFSLVNAVLLKPLPFAEPDRLMIVHLLAPDREAPGVFRPNIWSYPKYRAFRESQRAFESMTAFGDGNWNLTGTDSPERLSGEFVESSYFDVLGIRPVTGRTFSADETRAAGSAPLAMLGYGIWSRRFGSDPAVVGHSVDLQRNSSHDRRHSPARVSRAERIVRRVGAPDDPRCRGSWQPLRSFLHRGRTSQA